MPKLSNNESEDFTHYLRFNYRDLQSTGWLSTIGAANQRVIGNHPAGGGITRVAFYQVTDPAGATDLTIDVGTTTADPDEFIDNLDVDGLTKASYNTGDAFIGTDSGAATTSNVINMVVNNTASDKDIIMEFNGTVGSLTAGEWIVAWHVLDPSRFAR